MTGGDVLRITLLRRGQALALQVGQRIDAAAVAGNDQHPVGGDAGDYPNALSALQEAQKEVPAGDTANAASVKANLEKLKRGEDINK